MTSLLENKIDNELSVLNFQDQFKPPDEIESGDNQIKYSLRAWWSSIQANTFRSYKERAALYERALKCIPQCYKIWYHYLKDTVEQVSNKCPLSKRFLEINEVFERALQYMQRMPRIWYMYIQFLQRQKLITKVRQVYDRSLKQLPITQHEDIWILYTEWALEQNSVQTLKHIGQRYMLIDLDFKEEIAEYLIQQKDIDGAAKIYYDMLNDPGFTSKKHQGKYQLHLDLCDMIYQHADQITSIDCEKVMREGINKYVDEVGNLWTKLADYYIKTGQFDKARGVYREGLQQVMTARDFNIVYNAYLKFEQELVNAIALQIEEEAIEEEENENQEALIEEQIDRLEQVIESRKMLLTNCMLRANINSVQDWLIKIDLTQRKGDPVQTLHVFAEALNSIDPEKVENGSLSQIHIKFAQFYYKNGQFKDCNVVLDRATKWSYKSVEDVIDIWRFWIELLLKQGFYQDAILVTKQAIFAKRNREEFNLFRNLTLWQLYIDLEINFGTFQSIKAAYAKMMELKVITPVGLINYADFMEKNHYYEESFKIYETGIELFTWPALYEIWLIYIQKFIQRYGNQKLERTRDLFEKVLKTVPQKQCRIFYLMYADFEENNGILNHAFEVYDRMVAAVEKEEKLECYNFYIAKISDYLGITKSRPIFTNAIETFTGKDLVNIGLRFAHLERRFGEIDRARAIYAHISQFADPRDDDTRLWKTWNDFEVQHGNTDTIKDYIRSKKAVISRFNLMPADIQKIKEKVDKGEL